MNVFLPLIKRGPYGVSAQATLDFRSTVSHIIVSLSITSKKNIIDVFNFAHVRILIMCHSTTSSYLKTGRINFPRFNRDHHLASVLRAPKSPSLIEQPSHWIFLRSTMAKKTLQKKQVVPRVSAESPPPQVSFPEVSLKADLECTTILEDQILVIDVSRLRQSYAIYLPNTYLPFRERTCFLPPNAKHLLNSSIRSHWSSRRQRSAERPSVSIVRLNFILLDNAVIRRVFPQRGSQSTLWISRRLCMRFCLLTCRHFHILPLYGARHRWTGYANLTHATPTYGCINMHLHNTSGLYFSLLFEFKGI